MNLSDFLQNLTQLFYTVVTLLTVLDYLRHPNPIRRDIALAFLSLSSTILVGLVLRLLGIQAPLLTRIASLALIAQPYLLLRLVRYFRPLPVTVERGAQAGMVASWAAFILGGTPLSPLLTLFIMLYFVLCNGYAVFAFIRGAFSSAGVTRQRLIFAAVGSVLLALIFCIAALRIAFPGVRIDTAPLLQGISVLSALAYYFGFATPRLLRQSWQLMELRNFLLQNDPGTQPRPPDLLSRLRQAVARTMGTDKVYIALGQADSTQLILDETLQFPALKLKRDIFDLKMEGIVRRVWESGVPAATYRSAGMNAPDADLMQSTGSETLFLIPIATRDRPLGLLLVFLEYGSLFPDDDLNLLTIFAQHTAITLDNDRYTEDLEQQVHQRTAALERSNDELKRFAYVASHDLREPLRTVTSYLQLLKERYASRLDSDADEFIDFAVDGSMRMKNLIDSLLAYSRVETQQQNFTRVDLMKVLAEVTQSLKANIDESGANIVIEPLPEIDGDERQFVQLFQNLIGNAIKYQADNRPEIHISARQQGEEWLFAVKDNGIGMEPQYLERIFIIFQRLHNRTEYPGAGIGLAIRRKVVELHGGHIRAESEKGKGTTFYFTLPARQKAPAQIRQRSGEASDNFGTTTPPRY